MKKSTTNEWKDGLNLDLNPIVTPNTVLTDNLNGTFITYNGNEFCLQNDRGNIELCKISDGYTPVGIAEHNGVLYIVSVNNDKTEIGTYPSPQYPDEYSNYNYEISYELNKSYKPLHILKNRGEFKNISLGYTIKDPVTIEIQDSYDGSVNLILVADGKKPRIVNSGFSVLQDNKCKFVNRNQDVDTNIYINPDEETELIRSSNEISNIDLNDVGPGGQLKGGNYTFYLKFGDDDYNKTDIVAESGVISIFKGTDAVPSTISGTLLNELTDKMVSIKISGLKTIYSKIYLYYTREYSDTNGYRMTESYALTEPFDIKDERTNTEISNGIPAYQSIWITGFEQVEPINIEELNIDYHTIDSARAETQNSNMLFLGNVGNNETYKLYNSLKEYTLANVKSSIEQDNMKDTDPGDDFSDRNYYSTQNIYYTLGYWPNEWYRFGIVYILKDGSTTPVFNMRGGIFNDNNSFAANSENNYGVFKTPNRDVLLENRPISFKFVLTNWINNSIIDDEDKSKIIGWFVVRQKRIPTTICQGLSIGTDKRSYLPVVWDYDEDDKDNWYIESFLSLDRSKNDGEKYKRNGAQILQAPDQPHILRPFLEKFEFQKLSSIFPGFSADYLALNVWHKEVASGNSTWTASGFNNWYESNIDSLLSARGYNDDSRYVIITEQNIKDVWNDTESHTLCMWTFIGSIKEKQGNEYDFSVKSLVYVTSYEGFPVEGNTYYGLDKDLNAVSFYIATTEDLNNASISEDTWINKSKLDYRFIIEESDCVNQNALLSLDPCLVDSIGAMFDGSKFVLNKEYELNCTLDKINFKYSINEKSVVKTYNSKVAFIPELTKTKIIDENNTFSSVAGSGSSAGDFERTKKTFGVMTDTKSKTYKRDERVNDTYGTSDYYGYNSTHNVNLVRGIFTPYLGLSIDSDNIEKGLYSIRLNDVDDSNSLTIREQNNSPYYTVSKRFSITNDGSLEKIYRGDCYICKVGIRILRNFIDNTAPVTNTIVDPLGWEVWVRQRALYNGDSQESHDEDSMATNVDYSEINLSDLNAVDLGYWVTFPCLSSYNLGLRSIDSFHTDEMSLLGSPRSFYPLSGASAINKVGDSYLLNDGYSATVGEKRYDLLPDAPYSKSEFSNRIMFSNVHITDAFTNGYRTFQGVAYKDYDKQYGAITKLISLGSNIFIVMEHGLGLIPVNEKALMQTTTGEAIHIYGYGVLPDQMSIISQDFGSKYEHSIIRTPIGIYGIDTDAKKIWRYDGNDGFKTISDMKIETYLNDYLDSLNIEIGFSDIRTHYNSYKGDLMFTWYFGDKIYNICFNERQNIWTTRYDWTPIVSENINEEFVSLQKESNSSISPVSIWSHLPKKPVGTNNYPRPTMWYNKQHGFEFEFVVSDPIGKEKIFDNLQIISNNTQPSEMEISIIGDSYMLKRDDIYPEASRTNSEIINTELVKTTSNLHPGNENPNNLVGSDSRYGAFKYDWRLKENLLVKWQPFKDVYKFGRRIGNIQYKEDVWYANIEPIIIAKSNKEARIRDKWARIRIRYTGEDTAVITAITTLMNI